MSKKQKSSGIWGWFLFIVVMLFGFYVYATDVVEVNYPKAQTKWEDCRKTVVLYWSNWRGEGQKITVQK